jgi:hypothetical protein
MRVMFKFHLGKSVIRQLIDIGTRPVGQGLYQQNFSRFRARNSEVLKVIDFYALYRGVVDEKGI